MSTARTTPRGPRRLTHPGDESATRPIFTAPAVTSNALRIASALSACSAATTAMNRPSLEKFASVIKPKGIILINSSLISIDADRPDCDVLKVPALEIAKQLGNPRASNVVAVAAFVARSKLVLPETLKKCIENEFSRKPKLIPLNIAAVEAGLKAAQ